MARATKCPPPGQAAAPGWTSAQREAWAEWLSAGDASFRDEVFYGATNNPLEFEDDIFLVNARATWTDGSERFSIAAYDHDVGADFRERLGERPPESSGRSGHHSGAAREITFYGSSFIADSTGAKVAEAARDAEAVVCASFDLDAMRTARNSWGLFRDRRPDLYGPLLTLDGRTRTTG